MRKELIKFIEANNQFLDGRVFSFPAPASIGYPFAVLVLAKLSPYEESLSDGSMWEWNWQLNVYGERIAELEDVIADIAERLHCPGKRFTWGGYDVQYMRVSEMGESIIQEDQNSAEIVSGFVVKFSLLSSKG